MIEQEKSQNEWEGKITLFRNTLNKAMQDQQEHFGKALTGVKEEVDSSIGQLKEQVTDMQAVMRNIQDQITANGAVN